MIMNIPDNYDQFLAKEQEEKAWLDRLPKCDHCREPIQDEKIWRISGELYHEECAEYLFMEENEALNQ